MCGEGARGVVFDTRSPMGEGEPTHTMVPCWMHATLPLWFQIGCFALSVTHGSMHMDNLQIPTITLYGTVAS